MHWISGPILLTLAAVLGLLLVALLIFTYRYAIKLTHPPYREINTTPAQFGLAFEDVTFPTSDGLNLSGWFIPGSNGCTLILCHGICSTRECMLTVAAMLARRGYGSLLFDFRAHGRSQGKFCSYGYYETEDVAAAVAYLRQRGDINTRSIGIIGNSLGGISALRAAPQLPEIKAVVAESAFADFGRDLGSAFTRYTGMPPFPFMTLTLAFGTLQTGVRWSKIRPLQTIGAISPRAVLLISNLRDHLVLPEDSHHLYAAAGEPKFLWEVADCKHVATFTTFPEEYEHRVVPFFDEWLHVKEEEASLEQRRAL